MDIQKYLKKPDIHLIQSCTAICVVQVDPQKDGGLDTFHPEFRTCPMIYRLQ